jgi:hypothetical protein
VVTNDSIKLAQLWIELKEMKDKLDNEILPVSGHLGLEDPELMIAMEQGIILIGSSWWLKPKKISRKPHSKLGGLFLIFSLSRPKIIINSLL